MSTAITRIVFLLPIAAMLLAAYATALLIEWLGDLTRHRGHSESCQ